MFNKNSVESLSIRELRQGYSWNNHKKVYSCLFCGSCYQRGIIYKEKDLLLDAKMAVTQHIRHSHGSSFTFLTGLDKHDNGLSTTQKEMLLLLYEGLPDADIAKQLGNKAQSTVRNHRFTLREKYKEAKIFMSIMEELIEKRNKPDEDFVQFHNALPVNDDRVKVTEKEKVILIKKYFDGHRLISFPKKQKRKLILLQHIAEMFDMEKIYSDKEVNELLKNVFHDYVTIRRYLIEYKFLNRKTDGSEYWIIKDNTE